MYDVVIPTSGNLRIKQGSIALSLESIRRQSVNAGRIIVVSNGEPDIESSEWLEEKICGTFDAEYIALRTANRSAARNAGIAKCRSRFILFLDDDIIVPPMAAEQALRILSEEEFGCGAHRRYIPMDTPLEKIGLHIQRNEWQELDGLANDDQVAESGYRQCFRRFPSQSTFVSCFGMVPRCIAEEVLYDDTYEGWGLEDTDYMRRLLHRIGFRSLSAISVYHIDHLVSPYIWKDHWGKNFSIYLGGVRDYGYLRIYDLLQSTERIPPKSPIALLMPEVHDSVKSADLPCHLDFNHTKALEDILSIVVTDANAAALVLTGSALRLETPRDLDLVRVTFAGESGFRVFSLNGCKVEEQTISIPTMEATLFHPEWFPNNWFWIAGRYIKGKYLFSRIDIHKLAESSVQSTLKRRSCHLLTSHLGALIRCARTNSLPNRLEGLKEAASLLFLWQGEFPQESRFPYTSTAVIANKLEQCYTYLANLSVNPELSLYNLLDEVIIDIMKSDDVKRSSDRVFLPDSELGLNVLRQQGWASLEFSWTSIQR